MAKTLLISFKDCISVFLPSLLLNPHTKSAALQKLHFRCAVTEVVDLRGKFTLGRSYVSPRSLFGASARDTGVTIPTVEGIRFFCTARVISPGPVQTGDFVV